MANGRPGDHPYTDITVHGREAISPKVTSLVREIAKFGDERLDRVVRDLVWNMRPELANESWRPMIIRDLERDLEGLLDIAKERGSR